MTHFEILYGIVAGLALVIGAVLEWRRGGDQSARLAALEAQNLGHRVAELEHTLDRIKRGLQ